MIGTIVNTAAILCGSVLGSVLRKGIKEKYQHALFDFWLYRQRRDVGTLSL